jgi:hypothetical protein
MLYAYIFFLLYLLTIIIHSVTFLIEVLFFHCFICLQKSIQKEKKAKIYVLYG